MNGITPIAIEDNVKELNLFFNQNYHFRYKWKILTKKKTSSYQNLIKYFSSKNIYCHNTSKSISYIFWGSKQHMVPKTSNNNFKIIDLQVRWFYICTKILLLLNHILCITNDSKIKMSKHRFHMCKRFKQQ